MISHTILWYMHCGHAEIRTIIGLQIDVMDLINILFKLFSNGAELIVYSTDYKILMLKYSTFKTIPRNVAICCRFLISFRKL